MISLSKNQTISLAKESSALSRVQFGLGWDPVKKKKFSGWLFGGGSASDSIDLDASCVMLSQAGKPVDTVSFRHLTSKCRSVQHTGDNLTGEGDGDDEVINVDLSRLPAEVEYLAFTVNSFVGRPSTKLKMRSAV